MSGPGLSAFLVGLGFTGAEDGDFGMYPFAGEDEGGDYEVTRVLVAEPAPSNRGQIGRLSPASTTPRSIVHRSKMGDMDRAEETAVSECTSQQGGCKQGGRDKGQLNKEL